jgi:hypothetical protein
LRLQSQLPVEIRRKNYLTLSLAIIVAFGFDVRTLCAHANARARATRLFGRLVGLAALVLRHKAVVAFYGPQQHFRDSDPIARVRREHELLKLVARNGRRALFADALRRALEQADGNVAVQKGKPLEQKAASVVDAALVGAPAADGGGG